MPDKNTLKNRTIKSYIYGGNIVVGIIDNFLKLDIANPYGALVFSATDIISSYSNSLKNCKYTKLAKAAGAFYYGAATFLDMASLIGGNLESSLTLPFNTSMAYQLIIDTAENYKKEVKTGIKKTTFKEDIYGIKNDITNLFKNLNKKSAKLEDKI